MSEERLIDYPRRVVDDFRRNLQFTSSMSNPVVRREFIGILRNRNSLAMLLVLMGAFSLIVVLRWPTDGNVDLSGARSQQVFRVFSYTLLAGVLFAVPAFPAVTFVQEKNRGTLTLLIDSPLSPLSIYVGKFTGGLLFSLLLILTSMPASAACYAMGGIQPVGQVGMLYLILLACVLHYTTLGLMISTYVQSTDAAVRVTYAATLAVSVLGIAPYYLLQGQTGWATSLSWGLRAASPLPAVMEVVGHGDVGSLGIQQASTLRVFFLLNLATGVAFAIVTIARLNYRLFDAAKAAGKVTDERGRSDQIVRRLIFLVDPQRRSAGIPLYANPVMLKEFRTRKFGRSHWLLRLVSVCAVLSLLLTFFTTTGVTAWAVETIGAFMVLLQIALVVLITPSLTSGLLSSERESGGWQLLRMTPLPAFTIGRGKLLSVCWTISLILLATVPGYLVMIYVKPTMWLQVQNVLISLILAAVYTVSIGAAVGSLFRKTAAATTACYIVLIVLFLGPLLIWMGRDAPFPHGFVETALLINPTGAALSIIEAPGFLKYELLPSAWWVAGIASIVALGGFAVQIRRVSRPD